MDRLRTLLAGSLWTGPMEKDGLSGFLPKDPTEDLLLSTCNCYGLINELEAKLGLAAYAELYEQKAEQLKETIEDKYWDSSRKLFSDTNEKKYFSQHTNALAILIGLVNNKDIETVWNSLLTDKSLTECTLYFSYYPNLSL